MGDTVKMEVDNQSEDGEITKTPDSNDDDFVYAMGEELETGDSLDIKPPQAVIRHQKSHRREKRQEQSSRRSDKDRKSRHHDRLMEDDRHRDKHGRHRRHTGEAGIDRIKRPSMEHMKRPPEVPKRHDRKERISSGNAERVLEDLRERLLDKRRERREESRDHKSDPRRNLPRDESRENRHKVVREPRHEAPIQHMPGEKRPARLPVEYSYEEVEKMDRSREKRHKRSRKHERSRDKERRDKMEEERRQLDELERIEILNEPPIPLEKRPQDMTDQELRCQKLLEATREMERNRMESQARRQRRDEKRQRSPHLKNYPTVVDISDDSPPVIADEPRSATESPNRESSEEAQENREESQDEESSDSSSSSSDSDDDDDDDDDDTDSDNSENSNESNEDSDDNNPSPLSVGQLAKSDRSDIESPGQVASNGTNKESVVEEEKEEKEPEEPKPDLPPYYPAIQGCRSVEEYKCLNRIAEGTYGVVYRAEDRRTKEIVALKRLKMEKEKDGFPITSLREINTLLKAQHPNIVTVREIVVGSNMDKIFIVMDYVEHDLKSLMETMKAKQQAFVPQEIKCLMQQLLRAVAHLHDNWILHRDIKTSNLLLSHRGILKVGDFGLAREYGSPLKQYTSVVVTLWYRAPELLLGQKEYSTPIDMWSVGCVFAELLRMEALFPGKSEIDLLNRIFKELGTPNERVWPGYSKLPMAKKIPFAQYPVNNLRQRFNMTNYQLTNLGFDLLNKMLTYDPVKRITAEDAVKHSYFEESPLPIDPKMFPTWPAKSEFGLRAQNASPKPPSGGPVEFKQLGDDDELDINAAGFHMGVSRETSRQPVGGGFHLKF